MLHVAYLAWQEYKKEQIWPRPAINQRAINFLPVALNLYAPSEERISTSIRHSKGLSQFISSGKLSTYAYVISESSSFQECSQLLTFESIVTTENTD